VDWQTLCLWYGLLAKRAWSHNTRTTDAQRTNSDYLT
jgi:hypothetical protein